MATAAANLLVQTNTMKWKQSYPNNLFRSIPARPVKLKSFVSAVEKSHLIITDPKSNPGGHAESLQFRWGNHYCTIKENRSSANPNTAVKKPWKYALKALRKAAAAAVLVGMLLMYKPKSALADSLGRVRATMPPCSEPDWERLTASQHATMSKLAAASLWIVIYPLMCFQAAAAETAVAFDRHSDCFISASSYVTDKLGMNSAQNYMDQLSHQERFNFYELVNMNNLKRKRSRGRKSAKKIQDEYMEVTILVAVDGKHELLAINSVDDLKKALQKLVSIGPDDTVYVYGLEVLWKPLLRAGRTI
ncbi:hypothetical protein M0R45_024149 [Rubus argutus]|uniref:Uncharacterized protein n=1 Tax=Rubus argutus TaxID=59490 RepID=A0AAW1WRU3_RUBAR